jgi:hypothetical protein
MVSFGGFGASVSREANFPVVVLTFEMLFVFGALVRGLTPLLIVTAVSGII